MAAIAACGHQRCPLSVGSKRKEVEGHHAFRRPGNFGGLLDPQACQPHPVGRCRWAVEGSRCKCLTRHRDVRDVHRPDLVRPGDLHPAQQVRGRSCGRVPPSSCTGGDSVAPLCRLAHAERSFGRRRVQGRPPACEDADAADGDRGVASFISPSCSIGSPTACCRGGCRSPGRRPSACKRWRMPWPATASPRSSARTRARSSRRRAHRGAHQRSTNTLSRQAPLPSMLIAIPACCASWMAMYLTLRHHRSELRRHHQRTEADCGTGPNESGHRRLLSLTLPDRRRGGFSTICR
jgi:hypothetical protein